MDLTTAGPILNPSPVGKDFDRKVATTKQIVRIMRLTTFILLTTCLTASAAGHTQGVTLNIKDATLDKVFTEIRKQTGYNFLFSSKELKEAGKVTVQVSSATIEQVLALCFKNKPFTYTIENNTIVVKRIASEAKPTHTVTLSGDEVRPPIDIHGRIVNENGEPVLATIQVKGSNKGTTTNSDGYFELKNVDDNATLVISAANIETREIKLNGKSELDAVNVKMKNSPLDQVQIIAYGQTSKRFNTGDVTSIKASDIDKQPVTNVLLAIQGLVPGMSIVQSNGLPNSGVSVRIRGQNSINNGNDPLYIIDGVPYTSQNLPGVGNTILGFSGGTYSGNGVSAPAGNPFSFINPLDIESVDVLKDADATAIYGSRGANGVVLITTKKGKAGKLKADVNVETGWGKDTRRLDLLNTRQYLDMRYEAFKNDGIPIGPVSSSNYDLTVYDTTRYTDWQDVLLGGTAKFNDVEASVSGGNSNTKFLIGTNYHKETTVFPGDLADQKGSVHLNINSTSTNDKLNLNFSGIFLADDNKLIRQDLTGIAVSLAPDAPKVYNDDGSYNWQLLPSGTATWTNPLASQLTRKFDSKTNNLVSDLNIRYEIIKGLDVKANLGYTHLLTNEVMTFPSTSVSPASRAAQGNGIRSSDYTNNEISSWIIEPQLSYSNSDVRNKIDALIGTTFQQNSANGEILHGSNYTSDLILENIKAAGTVTVSSALISKYKYNALFGRLNCMRDNKYLVNLTARRDGSSRFGPANRFQNFGAFGAGWIFSNETATQKNLKWLSFGKLRGSYGITGNDQVGDYTYFDLYNPNSVGIPYQGSNTFQYSRFFTPDLQWELTRKLEAGIELGFLNDRVYLSANFYRNRSSNQLAQFTLPGITGFTSITKNLDAVAENRGWEFSLTSYNLKSSKFNWQSDFNISINRNKLISADSSMGAYYLKLVGHSLGSPFVYHLLGIDPNTGLYQVADSHGSPVLVPDPNNDKTVLIDLTPKFYGGFKNSFSYKNFELDFLFQFVKQIGQNYLYKARPGQGLVDGTQNQPIYVLDRWQNPGDNKPIQRFSQNTTTTSASNNALNSDQIYSDASFIRFRNLSFSWLVPNEWLQKFFFSSFRVYVQGQNLLTITNYKGLDPETKSSSVLPPLRIWTCGVNLGF